jgi:hypothetical protein
MKQYENIFVPNDLGFYAIQQFDEDADGFTTVCDADKVENVIILTVEELRDMWEEATDEAWSDARPSVKYEKPDRLPGFEGYLQSKGIKI